MPVVIAMFFAALVLTGGCAPRWSPYWPDYTIRYDYAIGEKALQTDQPLLNVRYRFTLPVYTPAKFHQPPRIENHPAPVLLPGQDWIVCGRLDPDILILHPLENDQGLTGIALGLAIHRDGRLYSPRPWYDLHSQGTIPQPTWPPPATPLFLLKNEYVVDCFESDLVYRGQADMRLHFEERAFVCSSAVPVDVETLYLPVKKQSTMRFHRLRVKIRPTYEDNGRYRVYGTVQVPPSHRSGN